MNDFRIDKIDIEGFRGYSSLQSIDFNGKSALLCGGNYCGKSSTLGAIEWCLFGDFTSVPTNISTLKKRDEFVNDRCKDIRVKVYLSKNGEKIEVTRTKQRNLMKTNLTITDTDGIKFDDEDAEKKLFQIMKLNLDDFIRSVYLHQESIRFLLTEDPLERNKAFDRLFGLDHLSRILESIPLNKIKGNIGDFSDDIEGLKKNLEFRLRENMVTLEEAKKRASKEGMKTENLSIDFVNTLSKEIFDSISKISKDHSVDIGRNEKIESLDDISYSIGSYKDSIGEIRKKLFDDDEIEQLNQKNVNLPIFSQVILRV